MSTLEGSGKIPSEGLVFYYDPLNTKSYSGSGTNLIDMSPKQYNATLLNGVSFSQNSFSFDGIDDWISINYTEELYSLQVPMSIVGWFNDNGVNPRPTILGQYLNVVIGNFVKLLRAEAGTFSYYPSKSTAPAFQECHFPGAYQINTWNFFSVTVDGNLTASIVTMTVNQNTATFSVGTMSTPNLAVSLRIGSAESTFLASQEFFSGKISNISIYNRVLTTREIENIYDKTKIRYS